MIFWIWKRLLDEFLSECVICERGERLGKGLKFGHNLVAAVSESRCHDFPR